MSMPRVVTLGETMILVHPARFEPVESAVEFRLGIGGAESNVACHLAALGVAVAWAGRVGDDPLGRRLVRQLTERGVDTRWVEVDASFPTGMYVKNPGTGVHYYRANSAASRMSSTFLTRLPLREARLIHVSGITPVLSPTCSEMIDAVMDRVGGASTLVSFDVNHRAALWAADVAASRLRTLADQADIVFVGRDEAARLWGISTAQEVRDLLASPSYLIVKDGAVGATEFARGENGCDVQTFVASMRVEVVEEVGAGDAYAAGYLAALLAGLDAHARLRGGHERAALSLQTMGDVPDKHTTRHERSRTTRAQ